MTAITGQKNLWYKKFAAQLIFDCLNFIQFWHVLSEHHSHNDKVPIRMQERLTSPGPGTAQVTVSQPMVEEEGVITMQNWFPASHQDWAVVVMILSYLDIPLIPQYLQLSNLFIIE